MRQTVTNASMDTLPYPIVVIGYAYKCVKNTSPASPVYDFMASPSGGFNLNSHNQVISFPRVAKTVFRIRRIPSSTANLFKPGILVWSAFSTGWFNLRAWNSCMPMPLSLAIKAIGEAGWSNIKSCTSIIQANR